MYTNPLYLFIENDNAHYTNAESSLNVFPRCRPTLAYTHQECTNDVLLGRGSRSNQPGNVKFRQHIASNRYRYLAASKIEKPKIAEDVVRMWRELNPPGRFLSRKDEDEVEGNSEKKDEHAVWYDVGDKKARLKTSMALRERTPDAVHYLQIIRQKEVEETHRSTNYVKQQLGMQDPYHSGHQYPGKPMPHHPRSFGVVPTTHHMQANSRRASFAGFAQRPVDGGMHRQYYSQPSNGHSQPTPGAPAAGPPRRSSLMGDRQAQLHMMQQQVEAQQRRIEMELEMEEHSERLEASSFQMPMPHLCMAGHLPSIPDQRESDHSTEEPVVRQVYPPKAVRTITNDSVPREASSIVSADNSMLGGSQLKMVQTRESRAPRIGKAEYFNDDVRPSKFEAFEDTEDAIVVEKYRSLLQGWADRENAGENLTDMDEDMESTRVPRKRGVDRTVSGCSVQSTLSELMAMSIMTSGTDEDCFATDNKSVSSEMVFYDDF